MKRSGIAIVDRERSAHGRQMRHCIEAVGFDEPVRWIEPSLRLPEELKALRRVRAVAVPLSIRGATAQDRFTQTVMAAIRELCARGIPVFVAAGTARPNQLAAAGISVSTGDVPHGRSTSEACVLSALTHATTTP